MNHKLSTLDFMYEPEIQGDHLRALGPFHFNLEGYRNNLIQALGTLSTNP